MKRVFTATCLAMFCAAGLGAQTQADDQKKKEGTQAKSDEKAVTMTGCLRAGDTPGSFILENVKMDAPIKPSTPPPPTTPPPTDPPSTPPPPPPPPTTPPTPPDPSTVGTSGAPAGETVRLIGAPADIDLTKHIGHTVKVTGMLSPQAKDRPAGTTGGVGAKPAKSINVKVVAHVSEKCPI